MLEKACSKLFLAGEYAILSKNSYAIIANVDKYTYLNLQKSDKMEIISEVKDKDGYIQESINQAFLFANKKENFKLEYSSDLYQDGKKLGLGSSASVVVVTIKAILNYFEVKYSSYDLFNICIKLANKLCLKGSLADFACVCFDDLILYHNIDVRNFKYEIKRISKSNLDILAIWTKKVASTKEQIKGIVNIDDTFLKVSNENTLKMYESIENLDNKKLKESIFNLKENLRYFQNLTKITIYSKEIDKILEKYDMAKTSGAGLGDFAICMRIDEDEKERRSHKVRFKL